MAYHRGYGYLAIILALVMPRPSAGADKTIKDGVAVLSEASQKKLFEKARRECFIKMYTDPYPTSGKYCNRTWDDIMCWPEVPAGTVKALPCVDYINGFRIGGMATKECTVNGTWYFHPGLNKTWTNFSQCYSKDIPSSPFAEHLGNIKLMYSIGYGLSLASLALAIAIMLFFKKLHCPRNTVHINLFISFSLRAAISFLKDSLMVKGVGLASDVENNNGTAIRFKDFGSHWECKVLFSIFNYALGANYMWIFVEGLYLHILIFVSVFSERSKVVWYIVLGWVSPLTFVVPWVIVRATLEDVLCWNTHPTQAYFWILRGPITATMVVNFGFFLNIVRVLFTKLQASNTPEARRYRYRKLAKSTLVLIPLFGVHYMVFIGFPELKDPHAELVKLYFEMFFNSFQGFLVALIYCFFNGEVRSEIKKKWNRYQMRRTGSSSRSASRSFGNTVTTYLTRARNSLYSIQSVDRGESVELANGNTSNYTHAQSPRGKKKPSDGSSKSNDNNKSLVAIEEAKPIMRIDKESVF